MVEGSAAVRQRSKKVTSTSRRSSPQRLLGGLSILGGPGYGLNVYPEPVGNYSNCCVQQSSGVVSFQVRTWSEGSRPMQGLIIVSRVRRRDMARLFDSGKGSSVSDSVRPVSMPTTRLAVLQRYGDGLGCEDWVGG